MNDKQYWPAMNTNGTIEAPVSTSADLKGLPLPADPLKFAERFLCSGVLCVVATAAGAVTL